MKRIVLLLALTVIAGAAQATELQTNTTASITVRTRTEFDLSVDDPKRYGLASSIPELSLNLGLTPWQKLGEKPRSPTPMGFLQFELDQLQIRYTNGAQPDYNAPPGSSAFGFGFNDPNKPSPTGYFGPVYMPNMRSGIVWGDWTFQMAASGLQFFWDPWNRDYDHAYQQLAVDWAYLDTRVQYRRADVATLINTAPKLSGESFDEGNYWTYDSPATGIDDLSTDYSTGAMVGLEYNSKLIAGRLKATTRYPLASLPAGETNGVAVGTDFAFTPVKGLTSTTSVAGRLHYLKTSSPEQVSAGTKLSYDVPLEPYGLKGFSLSPMVGYDFWHGLSGANTTMAQEISGAVTLHWPGMEGWGYDLLQDRTGTVFAGTTVAYKVFQSDLAVKNATQTLLITLYHDAGGQGGIIKNLGSEVVWEQNIAGDANSGKLSAYLDWTFKTSKGNWIPWTRVFYDNTPQAVAAQVGVKADKVVPKTQIGLTYKSGELVAGPSTARYGTVSLYCDVTL
jgi:hypothetical protein